MDKTVQRAFNLLRDIKSVAVATVSDCKPEVRIADVMLAEEDGLYFATAKGKPYYRQLKENLKIAVCGMNRDYVTVRIVGDIKFCDDRDIIKKDI